MFSCTSVILPGYHLSLPLYLTLTYSSRVKLNISGVCIDCCGSIRLGASVGITVGFFSVSIALIDVLGTSVSSLPSSGKSEGYVVTWDQVTNAAIWQAFSGVHDYTLVTSSPYTIIEHDDIIFADPNTAGSNITIVLPDSTSTTPPVLGKAYTIKNINPGGFKVTVATASGISSGSNIIENPITGSFVVNFDITQKGDVQDYIWDGTVWRHLGSQTLPIFYTSKDTYAQVVVKNASAGTNASSDLVLYNNQGDENAGKGPFIDIGINSNTYNDITYGNVWKPSDGYVYNYGGNLVIGPQTNHAIKFIAGGTNNTDVKMIIGGTSISVNTNMYAIKPFFDVYGRNQVQISATADGAGSGNTQAYVWAFQESSPERAETGQQVANTACHSDITHYPDGTVIYDGENTITGIVWNYAIKPYSSNSVAIVPKNGNSNTWIFDARGTLSLPNIGSIPGAGFGSIGDICRNGDVLYFKTSTGWKTVGLS